MANGASKGGGKSKPAGFKKGSAQQAAKTVTPYNPSAGWRSGNDQQRKNISHLAAVSNAKPSKPSTVPGPSWSDWRSPNKAQLKNIQQLAKAEPGDKGGDNPYKG